MQPRISSDWWSVANNPDLGSYQTEKQEPVDFAVWQAADGTWQLWSCIRHTACGGKTRLLYGWEGPTLTQPDWRPLGIVMEAQPELGETPGGLQAPHVIFENGEYHMFYGDWGRICLARSRDGKHFERVLGTNGQPNLFSGPYNNSRDPMVLKIDGTYYCYYTGHNAEAEPQAAVFCRTSGDMRHWSEATMVSAGGAAREKTNWYGGDCECPFVVAHSAGYTLFRNQLYGPDNLNTQYTSPNPLEFGVDDDRYCVGTLPVAAPEIIEHEGEFYIAALKPNLDGIRIARLAWDAEP